MEGEAVSKMSHKSSVWSCEGFLNFQIRLFEFKSACLSSPILNVTFCIVGTLLSLFIWLLKQNQMEKNILKVPKTYKTL